MRNQRGGRVVTVVGDVMVRGEGFGQGGTRTPVVRVRGAVAVDLVFEVRQGADGAAAAVAAGVDEHDVRTAVGGGGGAEGISGEKGYGREGRRRGAAEGRRAMALGMMHDLEWEREREKGKW